MREVHVQSSAVAKVWVHPAAVQDHLRHTFFDHLVVLRPEEGRDRKCRAGQLGDLERET